MKKIYLFAVLSLFIFGSYACKKTSTDTLNQVVAATAVLKFQGALSGAGSYTVSGQAKIFLENGRYSLALENFSSSNGPDLKVYLSQGATPTNFIKLGDLKSTNGNQVYDIAGSPDFTKYTHALIHCERFNAVFGRAELK